MRNAIPCFDAHCDTLSAAQRRGCSLRENSLHIDLMRLTRHAPSAQVFALFLRPRGWNFAAGYDKPDCPYETLKPAFDGLLDYALRAFDENADLVSLCRSAAQAREVFAEGRTAAFLAVEGAELLGCSEAALRAAYESGVRLVNLPGNYPNALSGSTQSGGGLTEKGRHFGRTAQALGVAVDLSHASDAAFWETLEIAEKPVLAGHSNARALCPHPRNLTDEMFTALAKQGGVAGLNLCPDFLGENPDVETAAAHIEHFLALGGEKAVCLGTDFDGIDGTPAGLSGTQDLPALYECLLRKNHPESLVRDIFFHNLMAFLEKAL